MGALKDSGDIFEQANADWIEKRLPEYEKLWAAYIGNNGASKPSKENIIPEGKKEDWKRFYQSHYSLAVYAYLFDQQVDALLNDLAQGKKEKKDRINTYLRVVKNFSLTLALLGQIRDMVNAIAEGLNDHEIAKKVEDFGKQRDNAIHAAIIPMADTCTGIMIPTIALKKGEKDGFLRQKTLWSEMADRKKFQYLETWLNETRDSLFAVIKNPLYPMIRKAAVKHFGAVPEEVPIILQPSVTERKVAFSSSPSPENTNVGSGDAAAHIRGSGFRSHR